VSRQPRTDPLPHLAAVAAALAGPDQPGAVFRALDAALGTVLGHKLFTVLRYHAQVGESERLYTNQPAAYPVGGRKTVSPTPWAQRLLGDGQAHVGRTAADIEAVFPDHALIAALGCASVLNLPVVHAGRVLGTVNLLHEAGWYDDADAPLGMTFAALSVPALI
jgi:hypothetical protein